ncbi:unnamed protein product [Mytilus coruscus]|uniref:Uncharacterized protein n=1 Tax=Mytilus coruscus TaxID=42192 RepID=A0A6J8BCC1_MYTCO|nr:unnamed protein product [Mytilus coruscus]
MCQEPTIMTIIDNNCLCPLISTIGQTITNNNMMFLDSTTDNFRINKQVKQIGQTQALQGIQLLMHQSNSNRSTNQETNSRTRGSTFENHEINEINKLNTTTLNVEQRGIQQEVNDLPKIKGKKQQTKSKAKEEISLDKAYISQLETQIERLTSTVEILQKSQNLGRQQNNHWPEPPNIQQDQSPINSAQNQHLHNFCSQLIEQKLNEHRIRNFELQMLQNIHTMQAQYQLMMQFQSHLHHQPYLPPKLPGPPQYHHSAYTQIPPPAVHQMYLPQNHQYVNTNLMYRQAPAYYRPTIPAQQRYHPTHVNQNTYVEQPTQPNVTTGLPNGYQQTLPTNNRYPSSQNQSHNRQSKSNSSETTRVGMHTQKMHQHMKITLSHQRVKIIETKKQQHSHIQQRPNLIEARLSQ